MNELAASSTREGLISSPVELSVIMPCYNESEGIETFLREWTRFLEEEVGSFEMVVVNDGSTDGTGRILDRLRKQMKALRVIHQLNTGHGRAVRKGMEASRGKYVLQVDANGRHEPRDSLRMWEKREEACLILGYRTHRLDNVLRRSFSQILKHWVRLLFGFDLQDANVPFRLVHRETAVKYLSLVSPFRKSVNLLIAILLRRDFPKGVIEIPIPYRNRQWGRSHEKFSVAFKRGLRFLMESLQLRVLRV